jgi:hypothetical protein
MRLFNIFFILALTVTSAAAQAAEAPRAPAAPAVPAAPIPDVRNAQETRQLLQHLFRQYPPSLSQVLRLDPSLLTNPAYLAPYPNLAGFLAQHPEIAHNPGFFIGDSDYYRDSRLDTPEARSYRMFEEVMAGVAVFVVMLTVVSVLCWIIKTVIDHRRWLRVSKIQSEVHSKLLDRFTSNQELLAYVETPAGRRFLESTPISIDPGSRSLSAPIGRILFSVQSGIVLVLAGVGLFIVSQWLPVQDIAQPLFVVGVLALAIGLGFVLSALVAYVMSRRLGLLDPTPLASTSNNAGVSPPHA